MYLLGGLITIVLIYKFLEKIGLWEIIGGIAIGIAVAAFLAFVISQFGFDFHPVFERAVVVAVPGMLYLIFVWCRK